MNTTVAHGTTMLGSLPNIKGQFNLTNGFGDTFGYTSYFTGPFGRASDFSSSVFRRADNVGNCADVTFDAHKSNNVYVDGEQLVVPSNLFMYWVVKY